MNIIGKVEEVMDDPLLTIEDGKGAVLKSARFSDIKKEAPGAILRELLEGKVKSIAVKRKRRPVNVINVYPPNVIRVILGE